MLERTSGVPVWSYFALSLIASAFLSTVSYDGTYVEKGLMRVIAISCGLFAFVAWCVVIPLIMHDLRRQLDAADEMIRKIRRRLLSQEGVDAELQKLAITLDTLCNEKVQLTGVDTAYCLLEQQKVRLNEADSAFETTQKLVRTLGFTVRDAPQRYIQR